MNVGRREILIHGLTPNFWTDVYQGSMTASWPVFLGALGSVFVLVNAAFASLYDLDPASVANANGSLLNLFFFSVETLTTVGYGEFYPQTNYAHWVVSAETFVGLFFTASMLGLIFARVSRPRARIIFARSPVIAVHDGKPSLVIRVANERLNMISSAAARLWLLLEQPTAENVPFRRFLELKLVRAESPVFTLSWTILHAIDETSPLYGLDKDELMRREAFLIVTIVGHDDTSAQQVQARHTYTIEEIQWDHRYVDILQVNAAGLTLLDYTRFHEVVPAREPPNSGRAALAPD